MKVILFITLLTTNSWALSSLNQRASFGFYRDDNQKAHVPIYYTFGHEGVYSKYFESSLSMIMSRDLSEPAWRVFPAYAYVTIPISQGFEYAWFRKSRLQLGRQILAQGFDYAILDGSQARLYWSPEGQILIYGGQTKNIDLFETNSSPLIGGSVQQGFFGYQLSAGYSVRESKLDTSLIDGGVMKFWEDLPWSPQALVKAQWSQNQNQPVQSLEELLISPLDFMSITLSHSYRTPRPMDNEWRTFVFRIFSQTPMESQQGSVNFSLFSPLEIQGLIRQLRFKGGSDSELGLQQEWSASTKISEALLLSCYVGYVRGFGGFSTVTKARGTLKEAK